MTDWRLVYLLSIAPSVRGVSGIVSTVTAGMFGVSALYNACPGNGAVPTALLAGIALTSFCSAVMVAIVPEPEALKNAYAGLVDTERKDLMLRSELAARAKCEEEGKEYRGSREWRNNPRY